MRALPAILGVLAVACAAAAQAGDPGRAATGAADPGGAASRAAAPVRLGAVYNLTGRQAGLDRPSADGALLAVRQIAARGGILGRPVELTIADGRSSTEEVAAQTNRLIDAGAVALLGLSDTDMVVAGATAAAARRRVFLTSGGTSPLLPLQIPEYLFLACFTDNAQAAAAAEFARRQLEAGKAWVMADRGMAYTELLSRYFETAFAAEGGIVSLQTPFRQDIQALRATPRRAADADLVFLAAGPAEAPRIVGELRADGVAQPILGGDSFDSAALVASQKGAGRVYFTTHAFLDAKNGDPRVRAFVRDYEAAYHSAPDAFAALGYDAVGLLADAIARAGSDDPEAIRAALAETRDYAGITGTISFAGGERAPRKTVYVLRAENGERTLAATILPGAVPLHELR